MCEHPTHQVNVSTKGVLCAPDSSKFFETPCIQSVNSAVAALRDSATTECRNGEREF